MPEAQPASTLERPPAGVTLRGVAKRFGAARVLDGVDLSVRPGEFLTLVGPSGCGKSTLLRVVAGLETPDEGRVEIGGRDVGDVPPADRDVAMVFQSYALYPHMSVRANLSSPLELRRLTLAERLPLLRRLSPRRPRVMRGILSEVEAVAAQLQLAGLLDRRPAQLSGGQRQRVALGRAMVRRPAAFLMDEPLSNLDAKLRVHMRGELAELHARLGATFVYVTHDQVEAMTMSDRVALMDGGRILQLGPPAELYDRPAELTVARFIGSPPINLLRATAAADGYLRVAGLRLRAPAGQGVTLGVRPEALRLTSAVGEGTLEARLRRVENLGPEWLLHAETAEGIALTLRLTAQERAASDHLIGERLRLRAEPSGAHLFAADGRRLPSEAVLETAA